MLSEIVALWLTTLEKMAANAMPMKASTTITTSSSERVKPRSQLRRRARQRLSRDVHRDRLVPETWTFSAWPVPVADAFQAVTV